MLESEIAKKLTFHAKKSLKEAEEISRHYSSSSINPEHLLFAIYLEKGSLGNNLLENMGVKRSVFNKVLVSGKNNDNNNKEAPSKHSESPLKFSPGLKNIIIRSYSMASSFNYPYVGTEHLVYALIESADNNINKILHHSKVKKNNADSAIQAGINNDSFPNLSKIFNLPEITLSKKKPGQSSLTPRLDQFCLDLNKDAREREEVIIGREKEIERIANILGRKNKNNPILIGDPGVGKTAIVTGLAQKINSGEVVPNLLNKKILLLDIALAVAGTSYRGEFEARLKEIIREATENKDVILFIDEIHNIVGAGNANGGLDAANILKPALSRGDIQCIGATTLEEYKKHIEKDPALERRLQPIKVAEPSVDDAREIIEGIKNSYEKFHNAAISREATDCALDLSVRYVQDRFLPDKALDIIDETASYVRNKNKVSDFSKEIKKLESEKEKIHQRKNNLVNDEKYEEAVKLRKEEKRHKNKLGILRKKQAETESQNPIIITSFDIATIVSQMTGIPLEKLSHKHSEKTANLEKRLNSQIIGQEGAIEKLVSAIYRTQSGISNPDRPLGSFLFLGPTGVGKTLTAKILAQDFFENPKSFIRIDMSEFMERHNVAQMIGAPAGYVGYGEGGKLTEKVRRNPYSLILFDEIEKAHPDVFNILLQILEDGSLTDAEGRQINFKNTIIILTSNMGTIEFTDSAKIGFESKSSGEKIHDQFDTIKNKVLEDLKKQVKPEFLNRLDNIVVFNALGIKEIRKIARLELDKLKGRLKDQDLILSYSAKVMDLISKKSVAFDQGARLVRKNVQEIVENKIAKMVVDKKIKNNKISLDIKGEKITV